MKYTALRPAIAMIELIFAIVIMGIALMSAPMLISTSTKSTFVAVQQEGINEAASRINMIMGYHWDESNTDETYLASILHVTASSDSALDMQAGGTTARRIGTPLASSRTYKYHNTELNASATLGSDSGDQDDIDDFIGDIGLTLLEAAGVDYVERNVNINTDIVYSADGVGGGYAQETITFTPFRAASGTTNIKSITTTLTSTSDVKELEKSIQLRAFSCNIGAYELKERRF